MPVGKGVGGKGGGGGGKGGGGGGAKGGGGSAAGAKGGGSVKGSGGSGGGMMKAPLSIAGAINLAVYLTISKQYMSPYAYRLLALIRDPNPDIPAPIARRLRDPRLYSVPEIIPIGRVLFGEAFRSIFESTIQNMTLMSDSVSSEIWQDVANEMTLITEYLQDVNQCQSDAQAEIYLKRRVEDMIGALMGVPLIVIPTPWYTPPCKMPVREIHQITEDGHVRFKTVDDAFISSAIKGGEPLYDTSQEGNLDFDFDLQGALATLEGLDDSVQCMYGVQSLQTPVLTTRYLTYNEIWDALDLGVADDTRKRYALGVPPDTNLESQHMDDTIGPLMILEDKYKVKGAWKRNLPGILKRFGLKIWMFVG